MILSTGRQHIVIVGAMGVGKTSVGRVLAARLGRPFLDSDEVIEQCWQETGVDIVAREGVRQLHHIELETFFSMLSTDEPAVIAAAASVVDSKSGRAALAEHITIWLTASDAVIAERLRDGMHRRPIDDAERALLDARRRPMLTELATVVVDTSRTTPAEVVQRALEKLPGSLLPGSVKPE